MQRHPSLIRDATTLLVAFAACLAAGLLLNDLRPEPLDLSYQTRGERLQNTDEVIPEVTFVEARRALAGGKPVFVDAREPDFFEEGHIAGAVNLPASEALAGGFAALPDDRRIPLIVYCSGGDCEDSLIVAAALRQSGFTDVSVFSGGWDEWSAGEGAQ